MALVNHAYDITTIVRPKTGDSQGDAAENERVGRLMDAIKRTIAPDTWDWVGGTGAIRNYFSAFEAKWWLIVLQDDTVQTSIQTTLTSIT